MECLSWLVALSPLLGQGLAVVPSRRGRGIAEGEVAGQLRRQSHSWELGANLGEGARAGQDRRGWGVHRERENTLPLGRGTREKGRRRGRKWGWERDTAEMEILGENTICWVGEWWGSGCSHILPVPHEMGHQGPTFKPQVTRWAASQSWVSRASSAKGCGMPTDIPVMVLVCSHPGDTLYPGAPPQQSAELPPLPPQLHFLPSPDKVTAYPLGFHAVCSAPRSPRGWTRAGRGMRPGRFVQTQALRGPPRSLVW